MKGLVNGRVKWRVRRDVAAGLAKNSRNMRGPPCLGADADDFLFLKFRSMKSTPRTNSSVHGTAATTQSGGKGHPCRESPGSTQEPRIVVPKPKERQRSSRSYQISSSRITHDERITL